VDAASKYEVLLLGSPGELRCCGSVVQDQALRLVPIRRRTSEDSRRHRDRQALAEGRSGGCGRFSPFVGAESRPGAPPSTVARKERCQDVVPDPSDRLYFTPSRVVTIGMGGGRSENPRRLPGPPSPTLMTPPRSTLDPVDPIPGRRPSSRASSPSRCGAERFSTTARSGPFQRPGRAAGSAPEATAGGVVVLSGSSPRLTGLREFDRRPRRSRREWAISPANQPRLTRLTEPFLSP
jgi:hypothetical protein